jgi:tetratricopeptide (TPR) repeat protein
MFDRLHLALLLAALLVSPFARAQTPGMRDAMSALARGDFPAAEQKLRAEISAHPDNALALSLLGAALDNLKRTSEADALHRRAIAKAPRSTDVLNNFAVHLWLSGNEAEAAKVYRQIIAIDPTHFNANLQLARLALKQKNGSEALRCLDRLPAAQQENPQVQLPRLEALHLTADRVRAAALTARLFELSRTDPNLASAAGIVLSSAAEFGKAESFFEIALQSDPSNFGALYNLGIAATRAGHYDRAREALEAALRREPRNIDVLYALACADHALRQWEPAVQLLSRAASLDPKRLDVQRMLAVATTDLGALEDAAIAWDRYLKLAPNDDTARRERGYTAAQKGQAEEGMADLEWYAARHPDDPVGFYELAQAERASDLAKAIRHLDKALALDPRYVPALVARGSLYYQQSQPEAAVKDLEAAASLRPDDAASLDRLGQAYQALDRPADAVRVLRKAAELAPADSKTLLHFARALADTGSTEESRAVMDRFRQAGPEKRSGVRAGFVEYLALSDQQRHADYRGRLEKAARARPADAALQVEYLKLLLADGDLKAVPALAQSIVALKPAAPLLADAGHALLVTKQYELANQFLKQAGAQAPSPQIQLDLAIATSLARAETLAATGKSEEAVSELQRAIETDPRRPELYQRAAALLVKSNQAPRALPILVEALRALPGNRDLLLTQAAVYELSGKPGDAEKTITAIQNRWPEWQPAWVAHGIIQDRHRHYDEAWKALETAVALGANDPAIDYYVADCALESGSFTAAQAAIEKARQQAPEDPWIQALEGRIAAARKAKPTTRGPADGEPPYLLNLVLLK